MEKLKAPLQLDFKEFLKRQGLSYDAKNPSLAYLLKKVRKNPKRLLKEDEILKNFALDLDQIKYFDLEAIENIKVFRIIAFSQKKLQVIVFLAAAFPAEKKLHEKLYLNFIEKLTQTAENPQILVYLHHKSQKLALNFLRNCYKRLPLKYLLNLQKFYVVHAGMSAKSGFLIDSSFHTKLLKKKLKYVKDAEKLVKEEGFPVEIFSQLPEEFLRKCEESLMVSHNFPAVLKHNNEIIGVDFTDLSLLENGLPEVIAVLVSFFEMDSKFVKTKGIFRNSASDSEIKRLEKCLILRDYDSVFELENPHVVASLLKRIFNKTLEPLLLFENYEDLVNIGRIHEKNREDYVKKLRNVVQRLPKLNAKVFSYMLAFIRKVIKKKDENFMDQFNMSMVFAPCFVRPKEYSAEDIAKTPHLIIALKYFIENYREIFAERFEDSEDESFVGIEEGAQKIDMKISVFHANFNLKTEENQEKLLQFPVFLMPDASKSDFEGKKGFEKKRIISDAGVLKKNSSKKKEKEEGKTEDFIVNFDI